MKKTLHILLSSLFVALAPSSAHAAFDACRDYFPGGQVPTVVGKAKTRDICFDSFAVLHSGETKTPVYTVEKLNRARIADAKGEERTNKFYEEARLPRAERATLEDYRGSGFDRGHMSPAGDMPTPSAMAQSFSLANMVPQAPENNRGVWAKRVEMATRQYAARAQGDVFVFTGPIYQGQVKTIGYGNVWVPTYLYKLVYDASTRKAWAFWVENLDSAQVTRPISYAEFVQRSGLNLLASVPVQ